MPRGKGEDEPLGLHLSRFPHSQHIGELFPGLILDGVHAFPFAKQLLYIDEEEAENPCAR